ncbi:MAG: ABC transporter permease, partial [Roseimicrobium sp.]
NRANLLTTLLEAPALALLISMVLRYSEDASYTFASAFHVPSYLFLTLVVSMFLGLTNSADEIIRDRPMLNRERNHNLRIGYYIVGKLLALSTFAFIQCVIYLLIGNAILELREMFLVHLSWMFLTAITGVCMGLLVSTVVHDIRTALNIIPLLLIPQIILGGALIKYEEMNRNLDLVYAIRKWTDKDTAGEPENASKLKVPFICHFMPLRWSYESVIISQAKLNPLTRAQDQIEDRIQALVSLPRHIPMTEEQRKELDVTKQALAVVSGLQDEDANGVSRRLSRIRTGLLRRRLDTELLEPHSKRGVTAEEIFVNRKVLDLVTKAEMEREDYRRTASPNVFFGTRKTYQILPGAPNAENATVPKVAKPWYREFEIDTLWMNFSVMVASLVAIIVIVRFALRRQLSRV